MSTPTWKKNLILIVGLLENLIFSGTILGWSALNYMLKSEGIYQDICDDIKPHYQISDYNHSMTQLSPIFVKNSTEKVNNKFIIDKTINPFNRDVMNLLLAHSHNDTNITLLEQLEAYYMEPTFSPIQVSHI